MSADEERALREELKRLEAAVKQHRALIVSQQMEELDRAMRWYAKNASECLRVIEALNHDGLGYRLLAADEVPFGDEGDEHRGYITELGRTWHNFVASAQSLGDHMWHQFKEEQPADLRSEYLDKKKELLGPHDVTAFVSRSRNVLLHRGVFNTGFTYRFTQTMAHFEADCRTEPLLNRYKTWWKDEAAVRYIESKAPRLSLRAAVEEHVDAFSPLYDWYDERVYEYHYETMKDFEEKVSRIREVSERLEPGSMPPLDEDAHFVRPEERGQTWRKLDLPAPPPRNPRSTSKSKKKRKNRKRR